MDEAEKENEIMLLRTWHFLSIQWVPRYSLMHRTQPNPPGVALSAIGSGNQGSCGPRAPHSCEQTLEEEGALLYGVELATLQSRELSRDTCLIVISQVDRDMQLILSHEYRTI